MAKETAEKAILRYLHMNNTSGYLFDLEILLFFTGILLTNIADIIPVILAATAQPKNFFIESDSNYLCFKMPCGDNFINSLLGL